MPRIPPIENAMKCPTCGAEYENESGGCPVCAASSQVIRGDKKKPVEPSMQVLTRNAGICPECGREQVGTLYRISPGMAAFLKVKNTDTFVPDKHQCVKKAVAG